MLHDKEETFLKKRLMELANLADRKGIPFYTDFLNLNEQTILHSIERQFGTTLVKEDGGYELAERKLFAFESPDSYSEEPFPITIIKIEVKHVKYSDNLTHRDYLGAILNLGIDRTKVGDIIVDYPVAYVFCKNEIAAFITETLEKIKHTQVKCSIIEKQDFQIQPKFEEIRKTVSSIRLDAIIALAFQGSRSSLSGLITGEKVFVNGKMISSNSYVLKEGDIVSVRGHGKFRFQEIQTQTKKGRTYVLLQKYI